MPSASISSSNMNNLVRDTYQAGGLIRSHQQPSASSQTSLQKLPASSPQFFYSTNNQQNQSQQHMQFPPPPPMAPLVAQAHVAKNDSTAMNSFSSLIVPQSQQQSLHQQQSVNLGNHTTIMPPTNGMSSNNHTQPSILMSSVMANTNPQQPQYQPPQQYQMQQQQPVIQAVSQQPGSQQLVPMTTIMIPATAAEQIQSASVQIQQAAMQAMANNPGQPQILVFMIPYMVNSPPTIPPTPEQTSLNSTLVRSSQSTSVLRPPQQQPPTTSHSRAVSSLSSTVKQEQEKFYIKANFSYTATRNKMELSFQKGDILHVLDTLQNSDYGLQYWLAARVKSNGKDSDKGLIPDKNNADKIALEQRTLELSEATGTIGGPSSSHSVLSASVGRVSFLKRRAAQRSKSLCKDNWDNVVFDIGSIKLPTYERVVFKHPGFCRPVVIFGPLADVAREKLLTDYPEKYSYPAGFNQSQDHPKVIRLPGILEVIDQGKHALLDITPSAVEKLNYANLAPIVIFMKTDSKSIIKEFRSRAAKSLEPNVRDEDTLRRDGKSSRKLLEQSVKLEKAWYHVFTATLNLSTMGSEMWYRKLRETIENQQSANVWMVAGKSDKKMASVNNVNEVLFPMPSNQSSSSAVDSSSALDERFSESLNISSKSTIDLLQNGTYGNRSQLRNAYAHSLAQKLARASSEPKLNGLMSENDDDEDEEEDDDEIIKKPFPSEFENSSSVSSSNGATSYGQGSMTGTSLTYQHYPPQVKSEPGLNRAQENIYARNPVVNNNNSYSNGNSSNSNYHPLPSMTSDNGYHNQSMNNINNNVIDLSRNHDTRGSAFQVYSDMNQNNYHYYNLNKI